MLTYIINILKKNKNMAKWELYRESPNPGGIATSSSETFDYNFPENGTSSDYVYRVVYNGDDGCTGSTKVTVKSGDCNCPCTCDNLTFPNGTTVELGPEEGATATCAYSFNCTKSYDVINVVSTPAWLDARVNRGSILFTTVTNTQSERTGTVTLSVCNDKCASKAISVKQNRAEACEEKWQVTIPNPQDFYGHGYDGGGTPVVFKIMHNGEPYEIVNNSDMIVNFGPNGSLNNYVVTNNFEMITGAGQGNYLLHTVIDSTKTCSIAGERIECSLAPKECPEAKANFVIMVMVSTKIQLVVNNLPGGISTVNIGFCGHLQHCDKDVKIGDFAYYVDPAYSYLNKVNFMQGIQSGTLKVCSLAGTLVDDNPECCSIEEFTGTRIVVNYNDPCSNRR